MTRVDHLLPLCDGWSLWKWFMLRGAGFSYARIAPLAASVLAGDGDRWLAEVERFRTALAAIEPGGQRDAKWIASAAAALQAGLLPEPPPGGSLRESLAPALDALRRTRAELDTQYAAESARVSAVLREVAAEPRFREAVVWQNRRALDTGIDALLRSNPERSTSQIRQHEQLVARYLQRYCTKNDTIGFFGPVSFGELVSDRSGIRLEPGAHLLAERRVYLEHWCVAALADRLTADAHIKPWLAPRLVPTIWLDETVLHHPEGTTEVPLEFARLLQQCDGVRRANEIAQALVADADLELGEEDEIYELLEQLQDQGLVIWKLVVPTMTSLQRPEDWLRNLLEQIGDSEVRSSALALLAQLEDARVAIERAAGDPEALDGASARFAATLKSITSADETRSAGQHYAARTPFYEDCRRDVRLELGADVVAALGRPLGLLLASARWYSATVADNYRGAFREAYDELRRVHGTDVVDYIELSQHVQHLFGTEPVPQVRDVIRELRSRWRELLGFQDGERQVVRTSSALATPVATAFGAPRPGWPMARYHAPDIQIAARSAEAIANGDCMFVVGELHCHMNTMSTFLHVHPDPTRIIEAYERDIPFARVEHISRTRTLRADVFSPARHDVDVELGTALSPRPRTHVLPVGQLVVDLVDDRVVVRTRDRARVFDVVAFHEQFISHQTSDHFRILEPAPHSPRVTIDSLVVSREQWTLPPEGLGFAHAATATDRFIGARRWARELVLPRLLFYKTPEERKPCFLDLDSPIFVEMFAKHVRQASAITLSEMLPGLDQLWLTDAQQQTYTCELRTIAVDDVPWRA